MSRKTLCVITIAVLAYSTKLCAEITGAEFAVSVTAKGERHVKVVFVEDDEVYSTKEFSMIAANDVGKFANLETYANAVALSDYQGVVDVWPANGRAIRKDRDFYRNLFKNDAERYLPKLKLADDSLPRVIVVDLKDGNEEYVDEETIAMYESKVRALIEGDKPGSSMLADVYEFLRRNKVSFMLREGLLKQNLLASGVFDEEEQRFLKSRLGAGYFCQLCEIFMNGMKQLLQVVGKNGVVFHPGLYLESLPNRKVAATKAVDFLRVNSVRLITYYPQFYKELYSDGKAYYRSFKEGFKLNHVCDEDDITCITTEISGKSEA